MDQVQMEIKVKRGDGEVTFELLCPADDFTNLSAAQFCLRYMHPIFKQIQGSNELW